MRRTSASRAMAGAMAIALAACGGSGATTTTTTTTSVASTTSMATTTTAAAPVSDAQFVGAAADPSAAPDPTVEPSMGYDNLTPSNAPDHNPIDGLWRNDVEVTATVDAAAISPACAGFVTPEATFEISWMGSTGGLLRFVFESDGAADPVLVVYDTEGNWWCANDSYGTSGATIDVPGSPDGIYLIFYGAIEPGTIAGTAYVTNEEDRHPR